MRCARFIAVGIMLAVAATDVAAGPYEVVAIYKPSASSDPKAIEIKVASGAVLPDRTTTSRLDRVVIRFRRDGLGAVTTGTFRNFAVATSDGVKTTAISIDSKDIDPSVTRDLVVWGDVDTTSRRTKFTVDIRGKFSRDFLCAQELSLRSLGPRRADACRDEPKPPDAPTKGAKQSKKAKADYAKAKAAYDKAKTAYDETKAKWGQCGAPALYTSPGLQPDRPLFADGVEVLFTYCRGNGGDPVRWQEVAKVAAFTRGGTIDALKEAHKAQLAERMISDKVLGRFMNNYAEPQLGVDAPGHPANLYVGEIFRFSVRHIGELYFVDEKDEASVREVPTVIAHTSRLILRATAEPFGACPPLDDLVFTASVPGEGATASVDTLPIKMRSGCRAEVDVDLKKYLDKAVTVRLVDRPDAEHEFVLAEASFKVASLGFQWTAPVISEVLAALDSKAQADLTATSSIPLGLAIGRGDRVRLALTFPFKASYNTRRTPNLSKYFAAFGHLTVLADTGDGFSTELAAGAGVSAFQVFNFGWAISLAENHRNYFLLSLDIPGISKFALAGFN